jgi:hypothetical protein
VRLLLEMLDRRGAVALISATEARGSGAARRACFASTGARARARAMSSLTMVSGTVNEHMAEFLSELSALAIKYKILMETAESALPTPHAAKKHASAERPRKHRAKKDRNAPKRPMSAYLCFSVDARAKLKHEHPELKHPELTQAIGTMWDKIPEADKTKYVDKSDQLKAEYAAKKQEYLRSLDHSMMPKKEEEDEVEEDEEGATTAGPTRTRSCAPSEKGASFASGRGSILVANEPSGRHSAREQLEDEHWPFRARLTASTSRCSSWRSAASARGSRWGAARSRQHGESLYELNSSGSLRCMSSSTNASTAARAARAGGMTGLSFQSST